MNKTFVRTNNVKNFIGLVENLVNKPKNIPKMGLIYGEPGLGKSQTALLLACKKFLKIFRIHILMPYFGYLAI